MLAGVCWELSFRRIYRLYFAPPHIRLLAGMTTDCSRACWLHHLTPRTPVLAADCTLHWLPYRSSRALADNNM